MKIKNILFVSLFAGAVLSSCDYTDLSPIDSITDKTYWTTTNDETLCQWSVWFVGFSDCYR